MLAHKYLIIGEGRVARHFQRYFSMLSLSFDTWNRKQPEALLRAKLLGATHILLLISDSAIEPFSHTHLANSSAIKVHFSGCLLSATIYGAHPLMTFGHDLYSEADYRAIPFIVDAHAPSFEEILPGLPNPSVKLNEELKAKYHAMCVLSGNFSCLLWQKLFSTLENELNIPRQFAYPYLRQQNANLIHNAEMALTGPLTRNDTQTIEKNIAALANDPFQDLYKSFVSCYQQLSTTHKPRGAT